MLLLQIELKTKRKINVDDKLVCYLYKNGDEEVFNNKKGMFECFMKEKICANVREI